MITHGVISLVRPGDIGDLVYSGSGDSGSYDDDQLLLHTIVDNPSIMKVLDGCVQYHLPVSVDRYMY